VRRLVYCTASFSICSLRRAKFPIIYPVIRLDYKLATLPSIPTSKLLIRQPSLSSKPTVFWRRTVSTDRCSILITSWNRITVRSSVGLTRVSISAHSGQLGARSWLRGDSYDSQRPSVRECGGCEGWSIAPLHSRSVRCDELNCRSSTQNFASTTNLQHFRFSVVAGCLGAAPLFVPTRDGVG